MRIQVSGQRIDIGESLASHATAGVREIAGKYAGRPTDATVVFAREGHEFRCEILVHLSTGLTASSKGAAPEIYAAFEVALERMSKQLRRHKRRLKDHPRREPMDTLPALATILAPLPDTGDDDDAEDGSGPERDGGLDTPLVIAETETQLPTLTVGEAVLQMELAHAPVLVFRNEREGRLNVVYRRDDGNIGWIDPRAETAGAAGAGG
jgi:ribosomal subunit interface protein